MSEGNDLDRLERAAAWRSRLGEPDAAQLADLTDWLAADPHNREAWQQVQEPWLLLGEHAASPALLQLRRRALAHAHDAARTAGHARVGRGRWLLATGTALAVVGLTVALVTRLMAPQVFITGTGERRVVTLADGSQITLDARSEVRVRYSADARRLALVRGRARFDVAHDLTRPFSVAAQGRQVIATGTAFDVAAPGDELLVTLIKGHVVVLPRGAATLPYGPADAAHPSAPASGAGVIPTDWNRIDLDPGEQLVVQAHAAPRIRRIDLQRATAWERGEIIFQDQPLSAVVREVDRYATRPVVVADPEAARLRISGVFHAGDVDGFVDTIASYLPLRRENRADGSIALHSR